MMIDRQKETTRPRRLASERAKAYFLSDASISKQLEKEERDLRKALKVSRMEALKARRNGNESKSVKTSSSSSTTSTSSTSSSSSSSSSPTSPLLSLPTTPKTTTKATRTAPVNPKRQIKMGKPKAMEISAKNIKGCCKTMSQVKPVNDEKPKPKWIIRTRSQNTNDSTTPTSQHLNYSSESTEKEMFNCDKQPNHETFKSNGKTIDSTQLKNSSTSGNLPSPMVPCGLPLAKDNGIFSGLHPTINSENCEKPRPKIMAQRKFASITYNCNTYLKPRDTELSPIKELFTKHKPSAEDFLTFLCFKRTDLLPPHLDFYSLNNITSNNNDGSHVLSNGTTTINDKTANGTTAANFPTNKSNLKQPSSNSASNSSTSSSTTTTTTTTIKTNGRNLANGKTQSVRKRAINFIINPINNRKKEPDLLKSSKSVNHVNRKNGIKSSKNTSYCETMKNNQRTNKTVKVTARACKTTNKSTKSTDENRPKKSFEPLKRPPKPSSTPSRHKSPTKVKISSHKEKTITDSKDDLTTINSILNGKVSKKSQPKMSNGNSEINDTKKVEKRDNCDRILRSSRASSSSTSSTVSSAALETSQIVANGKRNMKTEKLDLSIMINNKTEKSAINGNPVDYSDRKRKCNVPDTAVDNAKKRRTITASTPSSASIVSMSESRRSKKNVTLIDLSPSTSPVTSISNNSRKSSIKSVPHRIETRSHAKR